MIDIVITLCLICILIGLMYGRWTRHMNAELWRLDQYSLRLARWYLNHEAQILAEQREYDDRLNYELAQFKIRLAADEKWWKESMNRG